MKKFGIGAIALLVGIFTLPATVAFAEPADAQPYVYEQDFSDVEALRNDFEAHYQMTYNGRSRSEDFYAVGDATDPSVHFEVDTTSGVLRRKNDIDAKNQTDGMAYFAFTARKFVNFRLMVDMKMGDKTTYWPVICFRQSEPGRHFLEDGAAVFFQAEGKATLWGSDIGDVPIEKANYTGYRQNQFFTVTLEVTGVTAKLGAGDFVQEFTLPEAFFREGYVSLGSINNNSEFRNLRIEELPVLPLDVPPSQEPLPDAEEIPTETGALDELEGKAQTDDLSYLTILPQGNESGKTAGIVLTCLGAAMLVGAGGGFAALAIRKKGKKHHET